MNGRMIFKLLKIRRSLQEGQKRPNMFEPCQLPQAKKKHQNAAERGSRAHGTSSHHGLTVVTTTDCDSCHGYGSPLSLAVHRFLLRLFGCHAISAVLSFNFVLKKLGFGCKRVIFHHHFQQIKTSIRVSYWRSKKRKKRD